MYKFDGYDIELTRGDSLRFRVSLRGRELPADTVVLFSVKRNLRDATPVIEKRYSIDESADVYVGVSSADSDIEPGMYYWDIRVMIPLHDGTFEVITPMEYAAFFVTEVVGDVG